MGLGPFLVGILAQVHGIGATYMWLGTAMIPLLALHWLWQGRKVRKVTS
ncbi:hypothetical protein [Arthrobacter sp. MYb227]|nr:hypothetical protein [Arthrobacter sp. MYb227]